MISGTSVGSTNFNNNTNYNYIVDNVMYGVDWIYSYTDIILMWDVSLKYLLLNNANYGFFLNVAFDFFWFLNFLLSTKTLLFAVLLDSYSFLNAVDVSYDTFWFKNILNPTDINVFYMTHPELIYLLLDFRNYIFETSSTSFFNTIISNEITENILSAVFMFFQFVFVLYLIALFSIYFFHFFGSHTTEDTLIDHDYTVNTLLIESEEEIGSLDDMIVAGIIFFFVFGWYFYFNVFLVLTWLPETSLIVYLFPAIYYIIICIPTFLLYDFGLFFLSYLRGVGASSVIIFELVFDYIAFMAFYIRLCVQGVRLVLMTFVYVSLHDLILLTPVNGKLFLGNDSIIDSVGALSLTYESFSYFFFSKLPIKILYWIYELAHTFFVVTAQFIAFFAMVFWLFFFLYTFFVFEKFENYFFEKRQKRHANLNKILGYK